MNHYVPRKTLWTNGQDTQIKRLRTEGASCEVIAMLLSLPLCAVVKRVRALSLDEMPNHVAGHEAERPALAAGHRASWTAINRGTALEGLPFLPPGEIR